jgi:hypothetical protein
VRLSKHQREVAEAAVRHPELDMRGLGRLLRMSDGAVRSAPSRTYAVLGIRGRIELAVKLSGLR